MWTTPLFIIAMLCVMVLPAILSIFAASLLIGNAIMSLLIGREKNKRMQTRVWNLVTEQYEYIAMLLGAEQE